MFTDANASAPAGAIVAPEAPPAAEPDFEPPQPAATSARTASIAKLLRKFATFYCALRKKHLI